MHILLANSHGPRAWHDRRLRGPSYAGAQQEVTAVGPVFQHLDKIYAEGFGNDFGRSGQQRIEILAAKCETAEVRNCLALCSEII